MLGVFSGFYDTKNGKNKDIFERWVQSGAEWCVPSFLLPFLLCLRCVALKYALIKRFKGFYILDGYLY